MRQAFIENLTLEAGVKKNIWLLTGDLGYSVVERFSEAFPSRFINVGVAEQNMMGVAAGMASLNNVVFTYSISNFAFMRCLEQIRLDVCYHNSNVKIVSVGAGLTYGALGYSHFGIEDLSCLRAFPNLQIFSPCDAYEVKAAVRHMISIHGPCYLRLGSKVTQSMHENDLDFSKNTSFFIQQGQKVAFVATGDAVELALRASELLRKERGVKASVVSVACLEPLDHTTISSVFDTHDLIVSVEDHGVGGLASCLAELMALRQKKNSFLPFYFSKSISNNFGSKQYLRENEGFDPVTITNRICEYLETS